MPSLRKAYRVTLSIDNYMMKRNIYLYLCLLIVKISFSRNSLNEVLSPKVSRIASDVLSIRIPIQ